ncbi:MAG: NifB/NifX family molybdenum-iron cluster-binding protein [Phycisphaerae bacterium]|nr:NifB/NifX family molybdenum-iron cluster-binding protein [Phycisphaerae bacterium]
MKVAVTASGPNIDDKVDPRFGRCPCFVIVELDSMNAEAVENGSVALGQGAGIQAAQQVAGLGVGAVLTGNCGPNAHQTLSAAGIDVVVGCGGTVRSAAEAYKAGQLSPADGPNVAGHSGMAAGSPAQPGRPGGGMGQGRGAGGGRGTGRGGGMGRGRGQGGGGGR